MSELSSCDPCAGLPTYTPFVSTANNNTLSAGYTGAIPFDIFRFSQLLPNIAIFLQTPPSDRDSLYSYYIDEHALMKAMNRTLQLHDARSGYYRNYDRDGLSDKDVYDTKVPMMRLYCGVTQSDINTFRTRYSLKSRSVTLLSFPFVLYIFNEIYTSLSNCIQQSVSYETWIHHINATRQFNGMSNDFISGVVNLVYNRESFVTTGKEDVVQHTLHSWYYYMVSEFQLDQQDHHKKTSQERQTILFAEREPSRAERRSLVMRLMEPADGVIHLPEVKRKNI